jgi:glucose/arabinose dehydrogenase
MKHAYSTILILLMTFSAIVTVESCKDKDQPPVQEEKPLSPVALKLDTLLTNLQNPWGLEFLPDGSILIAEKSGKLLKYKDGSTVEITGLPVISASGQGGLMDLALHKDFENNGRLYFSASVNGATSISTALFMAKINGNQLENVQKLFQADPQTSSTLHFGSRIVLKDGYVYLCLGERNDPPQAQNTSNHSGCVIRMHDDGRIPDDNPYNGKSGFKDEIWTYGHRNPQGMALNPKNGEIWLHEHGPKGGDEINILKKGGNYGWPLASFGVNYNGSTITPDTFVDGTILPIYYWVPSIAPCGMTFYDSDVIPQWKGNLFLGALAGNHLNRLEISGNKVAKEERLLQNQGRFRVVKQGRDGFLYFATETPGRLYRYRPL